MKPHNDKSTEKTADDAYRAPDGTLYRPSNGTEGDYFQEAWCARCKADRAYRESGGKEAGCDLIARSMAFKVDEPRYPKEWVWRDGYPVCTAFDDLTLSITNAEREAQTSLFSDQDA